MKNKILITTSSFNTNLLNDSYFNNFEIIFNTTGKKLTEELLIDLIDDNVIAMIAGTEPITSSILNKASNLKFIVRCGIGIDNIDLVCATNLGIKVFNTPDAPTDAVAELTLGLIINSLRCINVSDKNLRNGVWAPLMGNLLKEKTVGIIGFGRIGKRLSELLLPFNCKIIYFDPFIKSESNNSLTLEEVMIQSDILTLHIPFNQSNKHLLNSENINLMKSSAVIINASRGGLIDESALYNALFSRSIAFAALDCFEVEPYSGPLLSLENILVTTHIGSYAMESRINQELESVNILRKNLLDI